MVGGVVYLVGINFFRYVVVFLGFVFEIFGVEKMLMCVGKLVDNVLEIVGYYLFLCF